MNSSFAHRPRRAFRRRYVAALAAVAVLSVGAQLLMQRATGSSASDAGVSRLAERQQTLSQKIAKQTLLAARGDADARVNEMRTSLRAFQNGNELLLDGSFGGTDPDFGDNAARVRQLVERITAHAAAISDGATAAADAAEKGERVPITAIEAVINGEPLYLRSTDVLAGLLQEASARRGRLFQIVGLALLLATLVVLEVEFLFVFEPAARQLSVQANALEARERQLTQVDSLSSHVRTLQEELATRRAAEERMVASAAQLCTLSAFATNSRDGLAVIDDSGRVEWSNAAFASVLRIARKNYAGRDLASVLRTAGGGQSTPNDLTTFLEAARAGDRAVLNIEIRTAAGDDGKDGAVQQVRVELVSVESESVERRRRRGDIVNQKFLVSAVTAAAADETRVPMTAA